MSVEEINTVADKVTQLNKEYNSRLIGSDLQLLRPYLQVMESLTVLKTIDKKSQPFALSLVISTLGIFKSQSELGIVGPALEKVVLQLADLVNATQKEQSIGNKKLFKDGMLLTIAAMIAIATIGANEGLIANGLYDEGTQKEANAFGLELLIHIAIDTNAVYYIFETLAEVCNYKKQKEIASVLSLTTFLLTIWAVSRNKGPELTALLQSLRPKIKDFVIRAEKITSDLTTNGQINFDETRQLIVILNQATSALESDDVQKFTTTLDMALNICEVEPEELRRDIDDICSQIKNLTSLLKNNGDEELNLQTSYWQAG